MGTTGFGMLAHEKYQDDIIDAEYDYKVNVFSRF